MSKPVRLVKQSDGKTSTRVDVEITEEGHLLFSGQDVGEAPAACFGDEDYEYWLKVDAEQKDRVLLALIEKLFAGNRSVILELKGLFDAKDIPSEFLSYV